MCSSTDLGTCVHFDPMSNVMSSLLQLSSALFARCRRQKNFIVSDLVAGPAPGGLSTGQGSNIQHHSAVPIEQMRYWRLLTNS